MKNKWSKLELTWIIIAELFVIGAIVYKHFNITNNNYVIELVSNFSAIFGVMYVVFIAKEEKIAYWFGIANVILYAIASYNNGLYLSATYNIIYSLPVLVYGYINWSKLDSKQMSGVRKFSGSQRVIGIIGILVLISVLAFISNNLLNGNSVWLDAAVSVLICVATFLMTKKYIEQWILYAVANFVGIILFLPKGNYDIGNIDLLVMWSVYFINSIYGWISWKKSLTGKKG